MQSLKETFEGVHFDTKLDEFEYLAMKNLVKVVREYKKTVDYKKPEHEQQRAMVGVWGALACCE